MRVSSSALIGYTGFVGSSILSQQSFDYLYNSKNIEDIQSKHFDLVVCAGAPGTKWLANKEPETDLATIQRLINNLSTITARKLVLLSTIDVYSEVNGVNEDSPILTETLYTYGKHRRMLEEFVINHFNSLIVRLPGLFGEGLKKNLIYDLLNSSDHDNINPEHILQFYSLDHLSHDINRALEHNLKSINIATEPTSIGEIAHEIFNITLQKKNGVPVRYNMQTKYASLWGHDGKYLYTKSEVFSDLRTFVNTKKQ